LCQEGRGQPQDPVSPGTFSEIDAGRKGKDVAEAPAGSAFLRFDLPSEITISGCERTIPGERPKP